MRSYPRIRKAIKWTSAVMVVVLTLAWAVLLKWEVGYEGKGWMLSSVPHGVSGGLHTLMWDDPLYFDTIDWSEVPHRAWEKRDWLWTFWIWHPVQRLVVIPFWIPLLLFVCVFGLMHRRDKRLSRVERGRCVKCGYDRAGLAAGAACPECGTRPPPPTRPASSS